MCHLCIDLFGSLKTVAKTQSLSELPCLLFICLVPFLLKLLVPLFQCLHLLHLRKCVSNGHTYKQTHSTISLVLLL